jgi:hypothetical protein
MKAILSIFVILLVLLLIISTLGGSIRTNEQFVESAVADEKSMLQSSLPPNDQQQSMGVPPMMDSPSAMMGSPDMPSAFNSIPSKPSFEQSSPGGTQNIYFIANPPKDMKINSDSSKEGENEEKEPVAETDAPILEGYDNADFYAPA